MKNTYTPDQLAQFVWDVNESLNQLYEGQSPELKHALEVSNGLHEAFRQAFVELFMFKTMSPVQWFEAEDGPRKLWSGMIQAAKQRSDALVESAAEVTVQEQMVAGEENPVLAALQAIAAGVQAMNEKMDQMGKMKDPDKMDEENPAPPDEEKPPVEA